MASRRLSAMGYTIMPNESGREIAIRLAGGRKQTVVLSVLCDLFKEWMDKKDPSPKRPSARTRKVYLDAFAKFVEDRHGMFGLEKFWPAYWDLCCEAHVANIIEHVRRHPLSKKEHMATVAPLRKWQMFLNAEHDQIFSETRAKDGETDARAQVETTTIDRPAQKKQKVTDAKDAMGALVQAYGSASDSDDEDEVVEFNTMFASDGCDDSDCSYCMDSDSFDSDDEDPVVEWVKEDNFHKMEDGGCAALMLVVVGAHKTEDAAKKALNKEGARQAKIRAATHKKTPSKLEFDASKVYVKDQRWCPEVVKNVTQKAGLQMKKILTENDTDLDKKLKQAVSGGQTLVIDGIKAQTYMRAGVQHIDDADDESPEITPDLWPHIATVRNQCLVDAYNHKENDLQQHKPLDLRSTELSGENGYFYRILKVYAIEKFAELPSEQDRSTVSFSHRSASDTYALDERRAGTVCEDIDDTLSYGQKQSWSTERAYAALSRHRTHGSDEAWRPLGNKYPEFANPDDLEAALCKALGRKKSATPDVDLCMVCGSAEAENMLLCDDAGCNNARHTYCCEPVLDTVPEGEWFCGCCVKKKIRIGSQFQAALPLVPVCRKHAVAPADVVRVQSLIRRHLAQKVAGFKAAKAGNVAVMRRLRVGEAGGPRVDAASFGGKYTALHRASFYGHLEAVQYLLRHQASVDASDRNGKTALHYAACGGHATTARELVLHGADPLVNTAPHTASLYGWTPLQYAVHHGHGKAIGAAIEEGQRVRRFLEQSDEERVKAA